MNKIALVVGVSGMAGNNLAKALVHQGFVTYGLSRTGRHQLEHVTPVQADLLQVEELKTALADLAPTHVYFTTWMRMDSEEENILVNSAMVRNLLDAVAEKKSVQHVSLVTGLKHYLGPFEAYVSSGVFPETPLREDQPRLSYPNFYYAQEDEVFAAAQRDGFSWHVHRPHTLIGNSVGNLMNMGTTLAVYASICKETKQPFVFPGSQAQWEGLSDVTDARILAKQIVWATETPKAANQAFNIVNGDIFRWKWLWHQIADYFGVEAVSFEGEIRPLEKTLEGQEEVWKDIASKYELTENRLNYVSSAWHTDLDLGRPIEVMTDMTLSRQLGFSEYQSTKDSFFDLFDQLKQDGIIPA